MDTRTHRFDGHWHARTVGHRQSTTHRSSPISATWVSESGTPFLPRPKSPNRFNSSGRHRTVRENGGRPLAGKWRTSQLKDPVDATKETLKTLPADLDLIVALSNLNDTDNQRITTEVPNLTLLLSTKGNLMDDPRSIAGNEEGHGTLWVETPDRGRFLQLVTLRLGQRK